MESLESLRSLDVSGGPPGTGRSTSPLPGTSERDFELDLTRARQSERREERREGSVVAHEDRAASHRVERQAERREADASRRSERDQRVVQADHDVPAEPTETVAAEPEAEAGEATATTSGPTRDAAPAPGPPESGPEAALQAPATPPASWVPPALPAALAPAVASATGAPLSGAPGEASAEAAPAAAPLGGRSAGSENGVGQGESEGLPRTEPAATGEAPDAPRAGERPLSTPEAPPGSADARTQSAARSTETPRAEAPAPAPAPAPEAAEHAAALLRQVRLRFVAGAREATLQLEPARLGRLSIKLELRRGATRAEVVAEEPEALALLARHEPELRAALSDAGFPGVEIELRQAGAGERAFASPRTPAAHAPLARSLAARASPTGGVDTYA
jgi:flagellar hook-length control protein FliK